MNKPVYFISSQSSKHAKNQDSFGSWSLGEFRLAVLCDGMGGLAKGELASNTIVSAFESWFLSEFSEPLFSFEYLRTEWDRVLHSVNKRILAYGKENGFNLGSTVVLVLIHDSNGVYVCHVGDSRVYGVEGGVLMQLTEDHTVLQRDLNAGRIRLEDAEYHPQRHVLLQAVGTHEIFVPSFHFFEGVYDRAVLCSDGFYNRSDVDEILIWSESDRGLNSAISVLRARGEDDDISVIVINSMGGDV